MFINYDRKPFWNTAIINAGLNAEKLVTCAQKTTTGAPSSDASRYIAGALVQNLVSGLVYINSGTSASPVWSVVKTGATAPYSAVFAGETTWTGSGTTKALTVTGVLAGDFVVATVKRKATQASYLVAATPTANTITFELSAANTSNDAVITYVVFR